MEAGFGNRRVRGKTWNSSGFILRHFRVISCIINIKNKANQMSILTDFLSGTLSGFIQVFVMQPFETIKIRLANQSIRTPEYGGIVDCFRKIMVVDGFKGFYQGSLSPLLGVGPQVALQFATNSFCKRAIGKLNEANRKDNMLSIEEALASGFLTGIPSALLVTPIDLARIQMQKKDRNRNFHGSVDAIRQIVRQKGLRGMFLGLNPTLLREMIALSVYFGTYEFWKNRYLNNSGLENLPLSASFVLGGFAGAASWLFTYPIDYVKTVMQSQNVNSLQFRSATHCARAKYAEEGFRTFYKGLGVTMLRSFPVNGIGFVTFELATNFFGRQDNENLLN